MLINTFYCSEFRILQVTLLVYLISQFVLNFMKKDMEFKTNIVIHVLEIHILLLLPLLPSLIQLYVQYICILLT